MVGPFHGDVGLAVRSLFGRNLTQQPDPVPAGRSRGWAFLGSWWIGLLVGIGMTIIPGVALVALFINNLLSSLVGYLFLLLGFPFYLAYRGVRRILGSPSGTRDGHEP